jgi:hypothetical protein
MTLLIQWIIAQVTSYVTHSMSFVASFIRTAVSSYASGVGAAMGGPDGPFGVSSSLAGAMFGPQFNTVLSVSDSISTALTITLGMLMILSFGLATLISIIVPLLISVVFTQMRGASPLSGAAGEPQGGSNAQAVLEQLFQFTGQSVNLTASAEDKHVGATTSQSIDDLGGIGRAAAYTSVVVGIIGVALLGRNPGASALALDVGMLILSLFLFAYADNLLENTPSSYQVGTLFGDMLDLTAAFSAIMALLVAIVNAASSAYSVLVRVVFGILGGLSLLEAGADIFLVVESGN